MREAVPEDVASLPSGHKAVPVSFRVKNSLASAGGRPDVAAFLQATNVLVGWELRTDSSSGSLASNIPAVRRADRLAQIAGLQRQAAAAQRAERRQPPQKAFASIISASLKLAEKHPVAPLAGFFHGERVSLSDLKRWSELDDATVYGELLGQIAGVPHGLVQSITFGDGGISALLDQQPSPLLMYLQTLEQQQPAKEAAAASS